MNTCPSLHFAFVHLHSPFSVSVALHFYPLFDLQRKTSVYPLSQRACVCFCLSLCLSRCAAFLSFPVCLTFAHPLLFHFPSLSDLHCSYAHFLALSPLRRWTPLFASFPKPHLSFFKYRVVELLRLVRELQPLFGDPAEPIGSSQQLAVSSTPFASVLFLSDNMAGRVRSGARVDFEGASCFRQRLVFSLLAGRPCRFVNIRAHDDKPGLRGEQSIANKTRRQRCSLLSTALG